MDNLDPKLVQNLLVVIGIMLGVGLFKDILKTVAPLLSPKKNGNGKGQPDLGKLQSQIDRIAKQVEEMHSWHNCKDDDGVFLWYTRRSMYEVLDKLVAILQEIRQEQRETRQAVDNLARRE
jgi:hypothetical protein